MSITFSSSENNYWCFFFIIIATRRKRRTQRDSETRERNEEKRTFCDRKTDELRIVAGFIIRDRSDDAFGTTSEKKYSFTFYSIIARRREAEEEPIARARARLLLFLSPFYSRDLRTKTRGEKNTKCASSDWFLVRDRSERSQFKVISVVLFIIIARRSEKKPKKKKNRESSSSSSSSSPSSKARTFLFLYLKCLYESLSFCISLKSAYFLDESL